MEDRPKLDATGDRPPRETTSRRRTYSELVRQTVFGGAVRLVAVVAAVRVETAERLASSTTLVHGEIGVDRRRRRRPSADRQQSDQRGRGLQ